MSDVRHQYYILLYFGPDPPSRGVQRGPEDVGHLAVHAVRGARGADHGVAGESNVVFQDDSGELEASEANNSNRGPLV